MYSWRIIGLGKDYIFEAVAVFNDPPICILDDITHLESHVTPRDAGRLKFGKRVFE